MNTTGIIKVLGIATNSLLITGCFLNDGDVAGNGNQLKNLIVIKLDELRYDQLGYMGHPVIQTPAIDELAGRGVVFTETYTVSPLCTPSRASFWTGKYTMQHGCKFVDMPNHMKPDQWSYINSLREAGYVIGLAGKNHCFNDEYMEAFFDFREEYSHFGKIAGTFAKKDKEIYEYRHSEKRPDFKPSAPDHEGAILSEGLIDGPLPFTEEECMTYRIAEDGIRFLEIYKDKPFMLHFSFPDPHWPNVAPDPWYSMYDPEKCDLEAYPMDWEEHPFAHFVQSVSQGYDNYTEEERKRIMATMYGQISYCDHALGLLMNKLEELDLVKNTVIVFTADHGNFGGRYGLIGKTKGFYDALVRIPLVVVFPDHEGGMTSGANIENVDVMPTIMQYLGFDQPADVKGRSFLHLFKKGAIDEHREAIFSEVGLPDPPPDAKPLDEFWDYRAQRIEADGTSWFLEYTTLGRSSMVKKDGWKYCYYVNDLEELYNCMEDPMELNNLAAFPEYSDKLNEMKKLWMDQMLEKSMTMQ